MTAWLGWSPRSLPDARERPTLTRGRPLSRPHRLADRFPVCRGWVTRRSGRFEFGSNVRWCLVVGRTPHALSPRRDAAPMPLSRVRRGSGSDLDDRDEWATRLAVEKASWLRTITRQDDGWRGGKGLGDDDRIDNVGCFDGHQAYASAFEGPRVLPNSHSTGPALTLAGRSKRLASVATSRAPGRVPQERAAATGGSNVGRVPSRGALPCRPRPAGQ